MSTEAQRFVDGLADGRARGSVPPRARGVLQAIASLMQERPGHTASHRVCYAKQITIARRAGVSDKTVCRHLADLERSGVVARMRRCNASAGRGGAICEIRIAGFSDLTDNVSARSSGPNGQIERTKRTFQAGPNGRAGVPIVKPINKPLIPGPAGRDGQLAAVAPSGQSVAPSFDDAPVKMAATDPLFDVVVRAAYGDEILADCRKRGWARVRPSHVMAARSEAGALQ